MADDKWGQLSDREKRFRLSEKRQERAEKRLSEPAGSLGEAIKRVPSQMGRNFADRVSQEFGTLGSATVAAVRTPGARTAAFMREVSRGVRGKIADALGGGQIGRYLGDKIRSGIRYDKDPQKNFERLRAGLVAASQDFQQIKGTISSVNKQTRELALVVKQVAEKVNRIEREQSVQQRLIDQLKQAADENKGRVSGLSSASNDNNKVSPASIAPQIDSLLSGAVGGALSRIPFSRFAKFGAWGLAAYAGYKAAQLFDQAAKNAPKETENQIRQAEEDLKSGDPKRQTKALGDLARARSLPQNSQTDKANADAIRAGVSIAKTPEEAAITGLVADYQRATTTQEKEVVLSQLSAYDYKTVQSVVSRFQVLGLMNDLDRYNGNKKRNLRKQQKSLDQYPDESVRRSRWKDRSLEELGITKQGNVTTIASNTVEVKAGPNTIILNSENTRTTGNLTIKGDLIIEGEVKVKGQPDWAQKAFNPDDNSPNAPRSIRQRRYTRGRAGAIQAPGVFGKASSVTLAERYARMGTNMEKQQFLAYGQLPRGFENVPGHMGILGSPGAVMARGAMPLGQFGGGGTVGGYGGMPSATGEGGGGFSRGSGQSYPTNASSSSGTPVARASSSTTPSVQPNIQQQRATPPSTQKSGQESVQIVRAVGAGRGYTKVEYSNGRIELRRGDFGWRNNNPGNIEAGSFANKYGAIPGGGRYALFPTIEAGNKARQALLFESNSYKNLTILEAIKRWAPPGPPDYNDYVTYAKKFAAAAGVPINTKMGELTQEQRDAAMRSQAISEGVRKGKIEVIKEGVKTEAQAQENNTQTSLDKPTVSPSSMVFTTGSNSQQQTIKEIRKKHGKNVPILAQEDTAGIVKSLQEGKMVQLFSGAANSTRVDAIKKQLKDSGLSDDQVKQMMRSQLRVVEPFGTGLARHLKDGYIDPKNVFVGKGAATGSVLLKHGVQQSGAASHLEAAAISPQATAPAEQPATAVQPPVAATPETRQPAISMPAGDTRFAFPMPGAQQQRFAPYQRDSATFGKLQAAPSVSKGANLVEQFPEGSVRFFHERGQMKGLNAKLVEVLKEASKDLPAGYHVRMFSGANARSTGTRNHPGGVAVDVAIIDSNGKRLEPRGFGPGNKIYEQLAQSMNIRGQQMFPGTKYIHGGAWKSSAAGYGDRMHYQIIDPQQIVPGTSKTSGQYSFEKGIARGFPEARAYMNPQELKQYQDRVRETIQREQQGPSVQQDGSTVVPISKMDMINQIKAGGQPAASPQAVANPESVTPSINLPNLMSGMAAGQPFTKFPTTEGIPSPAATSQVAGAQALPQEDSRKSMFAETPSVAGIPSPANIAQGAGAQALQPELPAMPVMPQGLPSGAEGVNAPPSITGLPAEPTGLPMTAGIPGGPVAGETVPGAETAPPVSAQTSTAASAGSDGSSGGGGSGGAPGFRNHPESQAASPGSQGLGSFGRCWL